MSNIDQFVPRPTTIGEPSTSFDART
jgi:hypothetical protein